MIRGIIGKKVGMTRVFDDSGQHVPVTVLQAGPCIVIQVKTEERDGYRAVQVGLVEEGATKGRRVGKPFKGHLEAAGSPSVRVLREFSFDDDDEVSPGDEVTVEAFAEVEKVDVTGTTKGRGFQGVVKRHGFHGGKATHGSMFHRAPGSIGAAAFPSKVIKGRRMPGQMGNQRNTQLGLKIVEVRPDDGVILVAGSVPGPKKGYVFIRPSVRH